MSKTTKTLREEFTEKLKGVKLVSINGVPYFGKKTKKDGVTTLSDAVEAEDTVTESARKWLKADNLGELQEIEIEGDATFATKNFTEDQKIEIEMVILKAARAASTSLANLINGNF